MAWYSTYFDDDFVRLYSPFLTPERTWEEVTAVLEILDLPDDATVLDLACGWGRHAVALAGAGLRVTGLDRSAELLSRAAELAQRTDTSVDWVRGDIRQLPFRAEFDAVLSIFSSLGYFGADDEGDLTTLREARRVLRPGGQLLIETMHRDLIAREFAERDWWETSDGERVWVEREFDAVEGVSHEHLRWDGPYGSGEKYHQIRIRTATEWNALLRMSGFVATDWFGDWDLSEFSPQAERLIVCAQVA